MSADPPIIETHGLRRVYRVGAREVHALRGVELNIESGHFIALKGRSGSGKTTLLNCLSGLDRPTAGSVAVNGRKLEDMNEHALTEWRRKEVGFIFQSFGLIPILSAFENVELMLRIAGMPGRERSARAHAVLDLMGLAKWSHHRPYELSGGQNQRVAIARALANRPRLILADEPTGELDSSTAREILDLFRRIVAEEHITVLMSSHDPLVDGYVDQILRMQDGQIVV
jgi:ABC-type lipoprotein export system ATPase subunit